MTFSRILGAFGVLVGLATACTRCDGGSLTQYCPANAQCWKLGEQVITELPSTASLGECRPGHIECTENKAECVGMLGPHNETCNGLDDDCDGYVDDQIARHPQNSENTCNHDECGECTVAIQECFGGQWVCTPLNGPNPEECNGLDDDCNCLVDDIDTEYFYPEAEYPNTVGIGECSPGVKDCFEARIRVTQPVIPRAEVCNGRDDDCDGEVDNQVIETPKAAVFVIDVSGSMSSILDAITAALCSITDPDSQFAIVEVSTGDTVPYVRILQDFADVQTTCDTLSGPDFATDGSTEYMVDGVLAGASLAWPANIEDSDRWVVAFTDEPIQTVTVGEDFQTEINDACATIPFHLGTFTQAEDEADWFPSIVVCGGFQDVLDFDPQTMANAVNEQLFGSCP